MSCESERMELLRRYGMFPIGDVEDVDSCREVGVPLAGVECKCLLLNSLAEIELYQRYKNTSKHPIEAIYVFPVDDRAAVSHFEARIGLKLVTAVLKKQGEAHEEYDDALASGHGAYLLESEETGVLSVRVGNLPPDCEVDIKLRYSVQCETEGKTVEVSLPTTIKNRYLPSVEPAGSDEHKSAPQEREALTFSALAPLSDTGLKFSLEAYMAGQITSISSSSHPIKVRNDPENTCHATVELGIAEIPMDKEMVVSIEHTAANEPFAFTVPSPVEEDKSPAVMVSFMPDLDNLESDEEEFEIIFLVDQSGSMGNGPGSPMAQCKSALQLFLRSLPEKCTFNIVGFGSQFNKMFDESQPYTVENLERATAHVKTISNNMGGTEIYNPLKNLLMASPATKQSVKQIFLLTDGAVGNTDKIISEVQRRAGSSRVFTFALGGNAGQALVRGVARVGNGEACFIRHGEPVDEKIITQLGKAIGPKITKPSIKWGGLKVSQQSPVDLPTIYNGSPYSVVALLKPGSPMDGEVTLSGKMAGRKAEFKMKVVPCFTKDRGESHILHGLTAQCLIRDLEERSERNYKDEITALSLRWKVLSSQTAFVAVEERTEMVEGVMKTVYVNVPPSHHTSRRLSYLDFVCLECASVPAPPAAAEWSATIDLFAVDYLPEAEPSTVCPRSALAATETRNQCPKPTGASDPVQDVAVLQHPNGSWSMSSDLARSLQQPFDRLETAVPSGLSKPVTPEMWATALAVAFLQTKCSKRKASFNLLEQKAHKWLVKQLSADSAAHLMKAATEIFQ